MPDRPSSLFPKHFIFISECCPYQSRYSSSLPSSILNCPCSPKSADTLRQGWGSWWLQQEPLTQAGVWQELSKCLLNKGITESSVHARRNEFTNQPPKRPPGEKQKISLTENKTFLRNPAFQLYQRDIVALGPSGMFYTEKMQHLFLLLWSLLCKLRKVRCSAQGPPQLKIHVFCVFLKRQKEKKKTNKQKIVQKELPETYATFII